MKMDTPSPRAAGAHAWPSRAPNRPAHLARGAVALAAVLFVSACAMHGETTPLTAPTSAAYLETPPGWMTAAPADTLSRGPWWTLFNDPVLDQLAPQVEIGRAHV